MLSTLNLDPILVYIFGVIICSLVFWLTCRFLMQLGRFGVVRMILLSSVLLSFVLPAIKIGVFEAASVSTPLNFEAPMAGALQVEVVVEASFWESLEILKVLTWVYLIVFLVLQIKFCYAVLKLNSVKHKGFLNSINGVKVVVSKSVKSPYSFGKTIFIGDNLQGEQREMVLRHEMEHVRLRHSWDNVLMEVVCSVFWFNPFFYLTKRSLNEVHEFEADSAVVESGFNVSDYKQLIFRQIGCDYPEVASGLVFSLTKKRIIMLTRTKRGKMLRILAILPAILMCLSMVSFVERAPKDPVLRILCDGKEISKAQMDAITPSTIASMTVLKDGVIDKFPELKGADQAIIITTKKGGDVVKQIDDDNVVVLYDGKRITQKEMSAIDPGNIKNMLVYKDKAETARAEGVIELSSKDGDKKPKTFVHNGTLYVVKETRDMSDGSKKKGVVKTDLIVQENGVIFLADKVDAPKRDKPVVFAETTALFDGKPGQNAFAKWCQANLKWPNDAPKDLDGRTTVSFVIEKDGSMTNVKLVRTGGHKSFDDAALAVVKSCNTIWTPAKNNGEPVRIMLQMPVVFKYAPVPEKK